MAGRDRQRFGIGDARDRGLAFLDALEGARHVLLEPLAGLLIVALETVQPLAEPVFVLQGEL